MKNKKFFVVLCLLVCIVGVVKLADTDYSYTHYREVIHTHVSSCTLAAVEDGGTVAENGGILCKETGKLPDASQINIWEGYVLWDSCYQYHSKYACQQLGD